MLEAFHTLEMTVLEIIVFESTFDEVIHYKY